MTIIRSAKPLVWGELDLPLFGLNKDWHGESLGSQAAFSLAMDEERLWFIAGHGKPARLHPASRPGRFLSGLWEYDVAELFISHPPSGRYFEFNLAPNAAWWSCEFTGPRQRAEETEIAFPAVTAHAELAPEGGWLAALSIPLDVLRGRLDLGEGNRVNVSFILGTPANRYLTATDLGGGEPDFHRPDRFSPVKFATV